MLVSLGKQLLKKDSDTTSEVRHGTLYEMQKVFSLEVLGIFVVMCECDEERVYFRRACTEVKYVFVTGIVCGFKGECNTCLY